MIQVHQLFDQVTIKLSNQNEFVYKEVKEKVLSKQHKKIV